MAAYESPLETAIDNGRMEIWNIMRERLELTDQEKLEQLCRMIMAGKMEQDEPWKEFRELLSSLPVELVILLFNIIKTEHSPIKDLYQVNTAGIEAAKKCTLLHVRERFQRNCP